MNAHPSRRILGTAVLLALIWLAATARPAAALGAICTFAGPVLTFGTISPFSGFPASVGGNIGVSCLNTNPTPVSVSLCLSIAAGPTTLSIAGSSSQLTTQVTGGATWPAVIGDGTSAPMAGPITFAIAGSGTYTGSIPLALTLLSPGSQPPPGIYATVFQGTDSQVFYASGGTAPVSCAALLGGVHSSAPAGFTVAAQILTQCMVAATSLSFPTRSLLNTAITANATVTTTCNAAVPVTVALDNGATGTGPTTRSMRFGANAITYGIYRDAGLTQPWGASADLTASISTGSGTLTAYGQVPPQPSVAPGIYTDVINVVISY